MHARADRESRRTIRLWPALVIVVLAATALAYIWLGDNPERQSRVLRSVFVGGLTVSLLLCWLVFLSRLRRRIRLLWVVLLAIGFAGLVYSLRFRGVSGDVMPQFGWRWSGTSELPTTAGSSDPAKRVLPGLEDYPRFLGPAGDGRLQGIPLGRDWSQAPRALWRQAIGGGWSAFAVSRGLAVTLEQRGEQELVTCYEVGTGRLVWSHEQALRFEDPLGGPGPRATPAIAGDRVFALGGTGLLRALDLETGREIWLRDTIADSGGPLPEYGVSSSPLVLGERVIVSPGGSNGNSMLAYDAASGERAWSGGSAPPAYGSPVAVSLAGRELVAVFNDRGLAAHDPRDGRLLWEQAWPGETQKTSQPVVLPGDRVFLSSGYGIGGKMFRVNADPTGVLASETVWETMAMKAKFSTVVYRDGFLYGLDDGILACIDADEGRRRWKGGRYGHGQAILVDDLLVILTERGEVALVEARPDAFNEIGRFEAIEGKTWNHPALAGRYLLVRNDREAACYELPPAGGNGGE